MSDTNKPLFCLGSVVATPGAIKACGMPLILDCLGRHIQSDWGCTDIEDQATNDDAVKNGNRILSAYPIDQAQPSQGWGANTVWIITEADRSTTTVLLPDEYLTSFARSEWPGLPYKNSTFCKSGTLPVAIFT